MDVSNGYFLSTLNETGLENENDTTANTYCNIGNIDFNNPNYKDINGKYNFKLVYINYDASIDEMIWKQSSWLTNSVTIGYEPILIPSGVGTQEFLGLALSNDKRTYLDGNGFIIDWFNPIGANTPWTDTGGSGETGMPGPTEAAYSYYFYIYSFHTITDAPTVNPTFDPTINPTSNPTSNPTVNPTVNPTKNPTATPSVNPTLFPTLFPSSYPSIIPTVFPTKSPATKVPTNYPSITPTITNGEQLQMDAANCVDFYAYFTKNLNYDAKCSFTYNQSCPTFTFPTLAPTSEPTTEPTINPSNNPTNSPTMEPTVNPTTEPTINPTFNLTNIPTAIPTTEPTKNNGIDFIWIFPVNLTNTIHDVFGRTDRGYTTNNY